MIQGTLLRPNEVSCFSVTLIVRSCRTALGKGAEDAGFIRVNQALFEECPRDSIDCALMEALCSSRSAGTVGAKWNDVGSWASFWEVTLKGADDNSR